jgi:proline iminopeptidase
MGQQHDYSPAYRTVKVPVLVIHGSEDLQPEAVSRAFAAWFPASRFVRIDGAGHFVFNEQPKRFAQAVGEFLREVAR